MSDPIADICLKWMMKYARHDDGNPVLAAREIRQQIGRELLERKFIVEHEMDTPAVSEDDINEVCQLEGE